MSEGQPQSNLDSEKTVLVPEAYPIPLEQSTEEKVKSPEELESERVAKEKLKKIQDSNRFALRFVNVGEYDLIMNGRLIQEEEAAIYDGTLEQIVTAAKDRGWEDVADSFTDWGGADASGLDIIRRKRLMESLRDAHERALSGTEGTTRERTINYFRAEVAKQDLVTSYPRQLENIQRKRDETIERNKKVQQEFSEMVGADNFPRFNELIEQAKLLRKQGKDNGDSWLNRQTDTLAAELGLKNNPDRDMSMLVFTALDLYYNDDVVEDYDQKLEIYRKLELAYRFATEPTFMPTDEELRQIIDSISYFPRLERDGHTRSYHYLLIYDTKVVNHASRSYMPDWKYLRESSDGGNLLGAVTLISDNNLVNHAKNAAQRAEAWSHPVFDNRGVVRYPDG